MTKEEEKWNSKVRRRDAVDSAQSAEPVTSQASVTVARPVAIAKPVTGTNPVTGAKAVTRAEAARAGEVVVLTIPLKAVPDLPKELFANVPKDVVVIDTCNYYPVRDGQIAELDAGKIESEWVASLIGRPVVKAFNNIYFKSLLEKGQAKGTPGRTALPVAGDPPAARAKVLQLVEELGFDPIDAGSLSDSWRQQPGTPSYTHDLDAARLKQALAQAERGRVPEYRNAANESLKQMLKK